VRILATVAVLCLGLLAGSAAARTDAVRVTPVVAGLESPVSVRSAPGEPSTLYVVEQTGTIRIVRNGSVAGTFLDLRSNVKSGGEQGLLALVFHPNYAQNHLFYVYYTDTNGDSRLMQYRSSGGVGVASSAKQLLFQHQPYPNHNGGDLQFDRNGYLYVGLGDGGSGGDPQQNAQNMRTKLGKLLRTDPLQTKTLRGGWQTVALGLRNPWRFSFDAAGNLWIGDVGQDRYEEIDFRAAARVGRLANYGWSRYEGRSSFDTSHRLTRRGDLVAPVLVYPHARGCSITGGYVVGGRYYYGDYCSGTIWSFKAGTRGRVSAPAVVGHIDQLSSFGLDGNGALYATSLGGGLYRIRP
jgi:glucose/arabinose dehydrogenase